MPCWQGLVPIPGEGESDHEPFFDKIKYISRSKYHPAQVVSAQPYAFIVAGDVYIPGYMVKQFELRLGDALRGTCRITTGARLPYRAVAIEQHVNADDLDAESDEVDDDDAVSSTGLPTGALREDDDESNKSDNSDDMGQLVAQHLYEYVERHGGEVRMAAPPSQNGTLAHYYRWAAEPAYTEVIKGWEVPNSKPGVHAFARSFPTLLAIEGRHPKQKIVSKGPNGLAASEQRSAKDAPKDATREKADVKAEAVIEPLDESVDDEANDNGVTGGAPASGSISPLNVAAREFHPASASSPSLTAEGRTSGTHHPPLPALALPAAVHMKVSSATQQPGSARPLHDKGNDKGQVVLSKAAMEAAKRAAAAAPPPAAAAPPPAAAVPPPASNGRPASFFGVHALHATDAKEQLTDLKQCVRPPTLCPACAQSEVLLHVVRAGTCTLP